MKRKFLIVSIFIVGSCSIIYELLISTTSSYFLGSSVKQFSLTIGFYLASMGVGSYLSRIIKKEVLLRFIQLELVLGIIGAFCVPFIYAVFAYAGFGATQYATLFIIILIGILTGLEVPLITTILSEKTPEKENISDVLTFDYLGALLATLLFPFFLIPFVGVFKTSFIFGLINIGVGILNLYFFRDELKLKSKRVLWGSFTVITIVLLSMLFVSNGLLKNWNDKLYTSKVNYHEQSNYQNIVLTKNTDEFRLYLDGVIQFSSRDEYRYHEALVHIPMCMINAPKQILILGGGEGLAAREVLKHTTVEKITIVDLDPSLTHLAATNKDFITLNGGVLKHPKVEIINTDAFVFLSQTDKKFDVVIADLPEPTNESLARLYTDFFYKTLKSKLNTKGVFITQAGSTILTPKAFWCTNTTLKAAGFKNTLPLHANIPSFGDWGFVLASDNTLSFNADKLPNDLKFIDNNAFLFMNYFPKDLQPIAIKVNNIDKLPILNYYLEEWEKLHIENKK